MGVWGERSLGALRRRRARVTASDVVGVQVVPPWRRQVSAEQASLSLAALEASPVEPRLHPDLGRETWRIADDFGWAKTYDAEYVALAMLTGSRLVTQDARLRRGTARLGIVVGPSEL